MHRWPRSAVLVGVLLLMLAVAGALAFQAQQAIRSQHATAQHVLRDYARFASWQLSQNAARALTSVLTNQIADITSACSGPSVLPDPRELLRGKGG